MAHGLSSTMNHILHQFSTIVLVASINQHQAVKVTYRILLPGKMNRPSLREKMAAFVALGIYTGHLQYKLNPLNVNRLADESE